MGYIPGFSGAAFGAGLQRDRGITNRDLERKQKQLQKYQSKRGLLGKVLGAGAGMAAGALLTPVLGPGGVVVGKAVASGLGSALGSSKMLSGSGPDIGKSSTGLGGRSYQDLEDFKGGLDKQMQGQALGAGAASLASGLVGMGKGAFDASNYGKLAPEAAQSIEGTSSLGMNLTGEKTMSGLDKFSPSAKAGMTGYKGFLGNISADKGPIDFTSAATDKFGDDMGLAYSLPTDRSLTEFQQGGYAFQKGGYVPSYQTGGALGKALSLTTPSIDTDSRLSESGNFINAMDLAKVRGQIEGADKLGTKKFMDFLGSGDISRAKAGDELAGMKFLEAAQGRAGERVQGAEQDLLGGIRGAKDTSSSIQNYLEGQDFFRQQDPSNTPYGQPMESMMNPFKDISGNPSSAMIRGKLNLMESGLGYEGSEEQLGDESAMSMFPEQYQDRQDEPKSNLLQRLFGRQMGGMMGVSSPLPYNMGGTVQQQPMAYQLGGLLKYNRSPGR